MGFLRIIGLLLLIPLLDAILLVIFGAYFGWQLMVLVVVLTGLIGLLLARFEGRNTLRRIQLKLAQGQAPTDELIDGGMILVAAAFLLTPGLVTDFIGFLFLIPLTRYPIRVGVKRWVIVPYVDSKSGGFATGNVYVGGYPGGDDEGPMPGDPGGEGGGVEDGFDDVTDVDYEEVGDDEGKSNA